MKTTLDLLKKCKFVGVHGEDDEKASADRDAKKLR
jgi:hypothetical protein